MKKNELIIEINRSVHDVFEFTINPSNTPKWIQSIVKEETSQWPISVGTIYRNVDKEGRWTEYEVIQLKPNSVFELKQKNGHYRVRYSYKSISDIKSLLTYFEWVEDGELTDPFTQNMLEKLKSVIEDQ